VDGVELERLPEEGPVALDPVGLENLVQAVGEVVEPIKPDGGGGDDDRSEEDDPLSFDEI
jgi:hypothetical protein